MIISAVLAMMAGCTKKQEEKPAEEQKVAEQKYQVFGDSISADKALTKEEMLTRYDNLKTGDTLAVKFKTTINEVCQKKGCWMTLDLGGKQESFVKFKDYAFFVPKNAQKHDVVVEGKAFIKEVSVEEQQHYAKDAGASQQAIDSITQPKKTLLFQANGVLIAEK